MKRYLNDVMFAGAIRHMENKYQLRKVSGLHWTTWYLDDKQVAGLCASPYPGPEYGTAAWVDYELTTGAEVVVQRSRPINHTEAYFLNKRLDYQRRYGRPIPADQDHLQIKEVDCAYNHVMANGGIKGRLTAGSFSIYWNECVYLY